VSRVPELLRRIEEIVAAMDPITREVFLLHRVEGWSYPRIAHALAITLAEVEGHVAAAIIAIDRGLRCDGF
jgi:DNA-directed RNA polymerase specialized sigma24 family protein